VAAPLDAVYFSMREATVEVSMGAELIVSHTEIDKGQNVVCRRQDVLSR
jgi:hypothetical protein